MILGDPHHCQLLWQAFACQRPKEPPGTDFTSGNTHSRFNLHDNLYKVDKLDKPAKLREAHANQNRSFFEHCSKSRWPSPPPLCFEHVCCKFFDGLFKTSCSYFIVGAFGDAENRRDTREELQTFGIPLNKVGSIWTLKQYYTQKVEYNQYSHLHKKGGFLD